MVLKPSIILDELYIKQAVTVSDCSKPISIVNTYYTPNGYIVPAEFGVHFLPRMKNIPKQTKLHLNEIRLTNIEFCKRQI